MQILESSETSITYMLQKNHKKGGEARGGGRGRKA